MTKREKCVTDGCNERKEFSVVFEDGCKGNYCEECKEHFEWQGKFYGIKSVKSLAVKK